MSHHDPVPAPILEDEHSSHRLGTLALAFCVGSAAALGALYLSKRRAIPAGPADGAPLMRAPLQVVAPVDLTRYSGLWHEQARLPNRFQKSSAGHVTAEYSLLPNGHVRVRNRSVRPDGRFDEAVGEARPVAVPGLPGAGRLSVRFAPSWLGWLPLVWGDYWILKLDRNYEVALVGTPDRQYLWVLSRVPHLDDATVQAELEYARTLGFDVDRVIRSAPLPEPEPAA